MFWLKRRTDDNYVIQSLIKRQLGPTYRNPHQLDVSGQYRLPEQSGWPVVDPQPANAGGIESPGGRKSTLRRRIEYYSFEMASIG